MKIAMIGHKDFPSRSGGVETVVSELSRRLTERGEEITVYNRGKEKGHNRYWENGVEVIRCFTFQKQSLNAMVYSFTATFHALFHRYDILHYHAIGPCVPLILPHLFGKKTVATVHGLNWRVDKWNRFASGYLKLGEKIAAKYADEVITLSEEMHRYFREVYGRDTVLIKNAVTPIPPTEDRILRDSWGIAKGEYLLYIGRISPEKGVLELIEAYQKSGISEKLVLAGEMPENDFGREVLAKVGDDPGILCTGFVEGERMHALYSNCALYVLPSHTEGLPLTLLEAMSCGANCLVSDIPENTSVLGGFGSSFRTADSADLAQKLQICVRKDRTEAEKEAQMQHIREEYGYERVIEAHLKLYHRVAKK